MRLFSNTGVANIENRKIVSLTITSSLPTGYDFWLTKLNEHNGNYIEAEMVKAFLDSIEYRARFGP